MFASDELAVRLQDALGKRYEIQRELGQGAHATVFLAQDLRHDRPVALKVLRADPSSDESEIRFAREIRVLSRLQHPNILPLHDSGHVLDMLYYVVPYVQGRSLREHINERRQLDIGEAVAIAREIAGALEYAHRQGVIHRDVKPENILLAESHPVLADFGIARTVGVPLAAKITKPGFGGPGTIAYMSPEQILGDDDIDARTDIYALGCVLFEMLAGKAPFAGMSGLTRRLTEAPPSVTEVRRDVPSCVHRAITTALARQPRDRFATAAMFAAALADDTSKGKASGLVRGRVIGPSGALLGREDDIARLVELLKLHSLVTLLGIGGVGKTRLAMEIATAQGNAYCDGAAFIPLVAVQSRELIVSAIAEALGLGFSGSCSPEAQLLDALSQRELLLILDGYEHLVDSATLVTEIIRHASRLRVLVTSRERLNIADETGYELHGLSAPSTDVTVDANESPAVRLFVERAQRSDSRFHANSDELRHIARACRTLGGLPLGVEIAASLVRVLTCQEIADELEYGHDVLTSPFRDVPARHRSLTALFEQSWTALAREERSALMRLSILRGAFRRDTASAVAGAGLSVLTALLDKSLLQRSSEGRFELHELVRQFAAARLRSYPRVRRDAEDSLSDHFGYYLQERRAALFGPGFSAALSDIADDLENVRAGWRIAVDRENCGLVSQYGPVLARFYFARCRFEEGDKELALAERITTPGRETAVLLARRGALCMKIGAFTRAHTLIGRSIAALDVLAPRSQEVGIAIGLLADLATKRGRYAAAGRLFDRALRLLRQGDSEHDLAGCLSNCAIMHTLVGRYEDAEKEFIEALSLCRKLGVEYDETMVLINLGSLYSDQGRHKEAEEVRLRALKMARMLKQELLVAANLLNLGESKMELGDLVEARALITQSLEYWGNTSRRAEGACVAHLVLGRIDNKSGDPRSALGQLRLALRAGAEAKHLATILEVIVELGHVHASLGDLATAQRLLVVASRHPGTSDYVRRRAIALFPNFEAPPPEEHMPASAPQGANYLVNLVNDFLNAAHKAHPA
jgi:predicted ATPase